MKTSGVPDWMGVYLYVRAKSAGLSESDHHLNGAGRALRFVRMAAFALDEPYSRSEIGEYHAYTGVSAARTAIDAIASWCNMVLKLGLRPSIQVSLTQRSFQKKVAEARPEVSTYVLALADLAGEIDKHRNRAQHREGLAISPHMDSPKLEHPGGWYLAISGDQTADLHLVDLLNGWADVIEENLREVLKVMAPGEMQEAEQRIAWLSKLKSAT